MAGDLGPIPLPEPGQKRSGHFTFQADPGLSRYQWPYFGIVGLHPGPICLVTAGIHAAEYAGIEAAIRLGRAIDPAEVNGTITIVPLLNRPGFFERSIYVSPEDNRNMNRAFPGRPDGTWSECFAHHFLNEVIAGCDAVIDLHAGDLIEDLVPYVIYEQTGRTEVDRASRRMVEAYGADWALRTLPTGDRCGLLYAAAAGRGIPAIIAESGRWGQLEEDAVLRHVRGVENVLRTLGVLRGTPVAFSPPRMLHRFEALRTAHEGIFHSQVRVGEWVTTGQPVGEIVDLLGSRLAEVEASADGVVLFLVTSPAIKRFGLLMGIGVPE